MLVSSSAAAGERRLAELAEVEPGLGDRQAADQVLGELVRLQVPQHGADLVHQRHPDRVLRRRQLDQPLRASSLAASASAEQVAEEEDLDPALAHPGHELVVLVLGPLDPQHVVEQQFVVVGRGQPLEAELRPVDHDLAQLAHLRVDSERLHRLLRSPRPRSVTRATTWVPARRPRSPRSRPGAPMAARLAGALDEPDRRLDLRAHRPGGEVAARAARPAWPGPSSRWSGVPQST